MIEIPSQNQETFAALLSATRLKGPTTLEGRISQLDTVLQEDLDILAKISDPHNILSASERDRLLKDLVQRYGGDLGTLHPVYGGNTTQAHVFQIANGGPIVRLKSSLDNLSEIKKNDHFNEELNSRGIIGFTLVRDWGPYYELMHNGYSLAEALRSDNWEQAFKSFLSFWGRYHFGKTESSNTGFEYVKATHRQAQKSIHLFAEALFQKTQGLPEVERVALEKEITRSRDQLLRVCKDYTQTTNVLTDGKPSNYIFLGQDTIRCDALGLVDQGWRDEVLSASAMAQFAQNKWAYIGLPHFDLGVAFEAMAEDKGLLHIMKHFNETLRNFVHNGIWQVNGTVYDLGTTRWDPALARTAVDLGRLYLMLSRTVSAQNHTPDTMSFARQIGTQGY